VRAAAGRAHERDLHARPARLLPAPALRLVTRAGVDSPGGSLAALAVRLAVEATGAANARLAAAGAAHGHVTAVGRIALTVVFFSEART
jgi:hypothetical protein